MNQDGYKKLVFAIVGGFEEDIFHLREDDAEMIDKMLDEFGPNKRLCIILRFGLGDGVAYTFKEIGKFVGITGNMARIHTVQVVKRLKHPSKVKNFLRLTRHGLEMELKEKDAEIAKLKEELEKPTVKTAGLPSQLERHVDELEVSVRTTNFLHNSGFNLIGELVQHTEAELLKTKNFGRKSLNELKTVLGELGLRFGMRLPSV